MGKVALVTGASSGIGLDKMNWKLFSANRKKKRIWVSKAVFYSRVTSTCFYTTRQAMMSSST